MGKLRYATYYSSSGSVFPKGYFSDSHVHVHVHTLTHMCVGTVCIYTTVDLLSYEHLLEFGNLVFHVGLRILYLADINSQLSVSPPGGDFNFVFPPETDNILNTHVRLSPAERLFSVQTEDPPP